MYNTLVWYYKSSEFLGNNIEVKNKTFTECKTQNNKIWTRKQKQIQRLG